MKYKINPPYEVRCPLHGSIAFDEIERRIMDHPLVQRLRAISQLGFAQMVYPGATHTRFSHSLGVMHLAGRVFDQICANAPWTHGWDAAYRARLRATVRLAGLLHDAGHPPFSHSFEPLLPSRSRVPLPVAWYAHPPGDERATHEDFSIAAIVALGQAFPEAIPPDMARDICALVDERILPSDFLLGRQGPAYNVYPLLKQIISGDIDADRMDYLRRDAHFAGVAYGLFDLPRLISSLSCAETPDGVVMTLDRNALHTYENFLIARFHMAMQVYFHKTLLPFEHFLQRAMEEGEVNFSIDGSLESLMAAREDRLMAALFEARQGRWSARLLERAPLSRLFQFDPGMPDAQRNTVMAAVQELESKGVEILHLKLKRRISTIDPAKAPILLADTVLGKPVHKPLQAESPLLEHYDREFVVELLYCAQELQAQCTSHLAKALGHTG